jgi:hypothetical protein
MNLTAGELADVLLVETIPATRCSSRNPSARPAAATAAAMLPPTATRRCGSCAAPANSPTSPGPS